MTAGTASHGSVSKAPRRIAHTYLYLLLSLLGVYLAMTVLSAIDLDSVFDAPLSPGAWRWQLPTFLLQRDAAGNAHFNLFNQRAILNQAAITLTLGVGMTFVILTGGIDLSVGSALALCNVVFVRAALAAGGVEGGATALLVGIGAGLLAGLSCGVLNGALTVLLRVPSFIVTLGTLLVLRGAAYWAADGQTQLLGGSRSLTVVVPIAVSAIAIVLGALFLGLTGVGRQIYAVGGSLQAARYSGVRTGTVRVLCFGLSGLCAGLAGIIYWSRTSTGSYIAGEGYELYAIAAVVLGGTRLAGGEGTIPGTMLGALIMAVLANGLTTASIHESTQKIIVGAVLVVAAYVDSRRGGRDNGMVSL